MNSLNQSIASADSASAESARLKSTATQNAIDALIAFAQTIDLRQVVYTLPDDPRVSDIALEKRISKLNDLLQSVNTVVERRAIQSYQLTLPAEYPRQKIEGPSKSQTNALLTLFKDADIYSLFCNTRSGFPLKDPSDSELTNAMKRYQEWVNRQSDAEGESDRDAAKRSLQGRISTLRTKIANRTRDRAAWIDRNSPSEPPVTRQWNGHQWVEQRNPMTGHNAIREQLLRE